MMSLFKKKQDWYPAPTNTTGMTRFVVANDLHIGAKYQDNPNAIEELDALQHDGLTIVDGDAVDRAACKKKDIERLTKYMNDLIRKFGDFYIMGNHERNGIKYEPLILETKTGLQVGFAHGDLISDRAKWTKYRMKPPGASWLGLIIADIFDDLDHLKAMRPLPKKFLPNAVEYCHTFDLDVLVCGHFHPESERRYNVGGKVIIVLPAHRINEVWI